MNYVLKTFLDFVFKDAKRKNPASQRYIVAN